MKAGLTLLWNQREKWLLFQLLTKEKWETTGRSGESTGRSQNISLIVPLFTFAWHSYVIMYLLCIKVNSVVVQFLVFVSISSLWFTYVLVFVFCLFVLSKPFSYSLLCLADDKGTYMIVNYCPIKSHYHKLWNR